MSRLPRVLEVEHLGEYRLRLRFSDGLSARAHGDHEPASGRPATVLKQYRPHAIG